jgi:hypothetical protein
MKSRPRQRMTRIVWMWGQRGSLQNSSKAVRVGAAS